MELKTKNKKLTDRIQKARDCKRSSARVYASNLGRIHREFLSKTTYNQNLKWLHDNSESLLTKLKKVENLNTQRNLLAASLVGLDLLNATKKREPFVAQISVLNKKKEIEARSGKRTAQQEAKHIDWNKIIFLTKATSKNIRNHCVRVARFLRILFTLFGNPSASSSLINLGLLVHFGTRLLLIL